MRKNLIFFLFVLLLTWISADPKNIMKKSQTASKVDLKNNIGKNLGGSVITTPNTMDYEQSYDNQPKKDSDENRYEMKNDSLDTLQRKLRYASKTISQGVECLSCYGAGISTSDEKCYSGTTSKRVKCADAESCFTELHPQYIKRGCMLPTSINRTFICKCPLCNDKPAQDPTYYEYKTISDWQYDNERLTQAVMGLDLLCKVCETTGLNEAADRTCKNGSRADYTLCGHDHVCYTTVDLQSDFVSRGCIESPAYNSMHLFCNVTLCNNKQYDNPSRSRRGLIFKSMPAFKYSSSTTVVNSSTCFVVFNIIINLAMYVY